jgi:hypothetical protein
MARRANSGREALKTSAVGKFGVTLSVYPGMGIYVKRGFVGGPKLMYYEHKKREGDFSCETSPSLFRFSEIRFGLQITTLAFLESRGTHELSLACSSLL